MASLAITAGAGLIGTQLASLLAGVVISLAVTYTRRFPHDRLIFRALALGMLVLSLTYTAVNITYMWDLNINHYGDPSRLAILTWHLVLLFPVASISCTASQVRPHRRLAHTCHC